MVVECALHDDVEVKEIVKEAVYFDDVGMIGVLLDLEFSSQLFYHLVLSYLTFGHYFDGEDHAWLALDCQNYTAESALT